MNTVLALKVNDSDNVATVFATVQAGTLVTVKDKKGNLQQLEAKNDLPYGHKIALVPISAGEPIIKYGEIRNRIFSKE